MLVNKRSRSELHDSASSDATGPVGNRMMVGASTACNNANLLGGSSLVNSASVNVSGDVDTLIKPPRHGCNVDVGTLRRSPAGCGSNVVYVHGHEHAISGGTQQPQQVERLEHERNAHDQRSPAPHPKGSGILGKRVKDASIQGQKKQRRDVPVGHKLELSGTGEFRVEIVGNNRAPVAEQSARQAEEQREQRSWVNHRVSEVHGAHADAPKPKLGALHQQESVGRQDHVDDHRNQEVAAAHHGVGVYESALQQASLYQHAKEHPAQAQHSQAQVPVRVLVEREHAGRHGHHEHRAQNQEPREAHQQQQCALRYQGPLPPGVPTAVAYTGNFAPALGASLSKAQARRGSDCWSYRSAPAPVANDGKRAQVGFAPCASSSSAAGDARCVGGLINTLLEKIRPDGLEHHVPPTAPVQRSKLPFHHSNQYSFRITNPLSSSSPQPSARTPAPSPPPPSGFKVPFPKATAPLKLDIWQPPPSVSTSQNPRKQLHRKQSHPSSVTPSSSSFAPPAASTSTPVSPSSTSSASETPPTQAPATLAPPAAISSPSSTPTTNSTSSVTAPTSPLSPPSSSPYSANTPPSSQSQCRIPHDIKLIYNNTPLKDPQKFTPELLSIVRAPSYSNYMGYFDAIQVNEAHALYTSLATSQAKRGRAAKFAPVLTPSDFSEVSKNTNTSTEAKYAAAMAAERVTVTDAEMERCAIHMRCRGVPDTKVWVCPVIGCEIRVYNQEDFRWHMNAHNSQPRCVCPYCSESFNLKTFLDYHIIIDHRGFQVPRFVEFQDLENMCGVLTALSDRLSKPDILSMFIEAERKLKSNASVMNSIATIQA